MKPVAVLFLLATTSAAFGQTTVTKSAVAHRSTASAATPGLVTNPPGTPKVVGLPKTLYSLRYIDTVIGTGDLAVPRKWYTVNYTGYLTNGTKFDSSFDRNQPITFPYGARRVIPGWDTGFEGMHVGGKRRLYIPYQLAYGEAGNEKIPAKSNLVFDVELLGMSDTPPTPPAQPKAAEPAPSSGSGSAPAGAPPASTPPEGGLSAKPATPPAAPAPPSK